MSQAAKPLRFKVRARATCVQWTCPACGTYNSTQLPPGTFKLRCTYRRCHRKFLYGIKLYEMPRGGEIQLPDDFIVYDERAFGEGFMRSLGDLIEPLREAEMAPEPYHRGEPLNELVRVREVPLDENSAEVAEKVDEN